MDVVGSTGGVGSPAAPAGSDSSAMAVKEGIGVRDDRRRDLGGVLGCDLSSAPRRAMAASFTAHEMPVGIWGL